MLKKPIMEILINKLKLKIKNKMDHILIITEKEIIKLKVNIKREIKKQYYLLITKMEN